MPWISLARLIYISRRRRIDPSRVEVYVEAEAIGLRPRNPQQERFEPDQDSEFDEPEFDDDEEY